MSVKTMYVRFVHTLLILILCHWVQPEVFTAISDIEPLLETQKRIIDDFNKYIVLEEKRLSTLKKRLKHYQTEHEKALHDIPDYMGNPISAFTLIKRLSTDLDYIRNFIESAIDNSRNITTNHENFKYPSREDLTGAAEAISRLQDVYKLDTHELSAGVLKLVHSNPITAEDCFELGRTLYDADDFKTALSWLTEAQRKFENDSELYQLSEIDIVEYIAASHFHLGDLKSAFASAKQAVMLDPKNERATNFTILCAKLIATEETKEMIKQLVGDKTSPEPMTDEERDLSFYEENYKLLCRGEMEVPPAVGKSLNCEYITRNQPFLKIAPFKVEHISLQPKIIVFHDVMGDSEIEFIQKVAKSRFERAKVIDPSGPTISKIRISKTAWLVDGESAVTARVSQRVADMTGLSMDTAEDLQVANYGLGGYYTPHNDFKPSMSDVAQGGATVFPRAGVRVVPKKGSAAFWYNLHPSGEGDLDTRHAACPVLRGSKWVSTRWIHSIGQEFLKPCKLDNQTADMEPVTHR